MLPQRNYGCNPLILSGISRTQGWKCEDVLLFCVLYPANLVSYSFGASVRRIIILKTPHWILGNCDKHYLQLFMDMGTVSQSKKKKT